MTICSANPIIKSGLLIAKGNYKNNSIKYLRIIATINTVLALLRQLEIIIELLLPFLNKTTIF